MRQNSLLCLPWFFLMNCLYCVSLSYSHSDNADFYTTEKNRYKSLQGTVISLDAELVKKLCLCRYLHEQMSACLNILEMSRRRNGCSIITAMGLNVSEKPSASSTPFPLKLYVLQVQEDSISLSRFQNTISEAHTIVFLEIKS